MQGMTLTAMGMLWPYFLPSVQHALNRTSHGATGSSPFEIFRGYQPLPDDHQLGIGNSTSSSTYGSQDLSVDRFLD